VPLVVPVVPPGLDVPPAAVPPVLPPVLPAVGVVPPTAPPELVTALVAVVPPAVLFPPVALLLPATALLPPSALLLATEAPPLALLLLLLLAAELPPLALLLDLLELPELPPWEPLALDAEFPPDEPVSIPESFEHDMTRTGRPRHRAANSDFFMGEPPRAWTDPTCEAQGVVNPSATACLESVAAGPKYLSEKLDHSLMVTTTQALPRPFPSG
jgi:hypothetical protein